MKHDWEYKKIKDITSLFTDGDWIESKDQSVSGIRLVQTGNIGDGFYIGKEDRPHFISEETFERLKCTEIFEGDCLISRLPQPLGRSCLLPKLDCRTITAVDCSILRFKNICDSHYFVYYTQSSKYQNTVDINATGTTRKRISRKNLENMSVPIPPLSTQQSIVSELDSLSKIIADCKETLKDYDAMEQSIFYDMFGDPVKNEKGWEVKKVEDIGSCCSGGTPSRSHPEYFEGDIIWYSAGELNDLYLGESIEKITDSALNNSSAKLCKAGSLFVGMYDTAAFKMGIATVDSCSNQACANVTLNDYNNVIWLYFTFLFMKEEALKNRHGARQKNLNLGYIKNFNIPVPPLPLQQQFASKIEAIEQMKEETKKALQEAETLFQARMDYWFN